MKDHVYFKRYAFQEIKLREPVPENLGLSVVIPAFDEPEILKTLNALVKCDLPSCNTEVLIVINYGEKSDPEIKQRSNEQAVQLKSWAQTHSSASLKFYVILEKDIKRKHAGPGYARKIGMDEASVRFANINNHKGIIASLDADCVVDKNYLTAIDDHWQRFPETNGVSINYEHFLSGDMDDKVYEGIINYELHLRYYVDAQRFCRFPFAFQTVGSSFAVAAPAYMKQGGMNKRKAGEDFYFIHKITPLEEYYDLNTTTVYPSPRPSDRVPFGTGRSINEYLANPDKEFETYNFQTFIDLKKFFDLIPELYNVQNPVDNYLNGLPEAIGSFLKDQDFETHLEKINANTQSKRTFMKAFFRWFDAFKVMKYAHYARDHFYPNISVTKAASDLLKALGHNTEKLQTTKEMLEFYRRIDKTTSQYQADF